MLDVFVIGIIFLVALSIGVIFYLKAGSRRISTVPGPDPTTKEDGNLADMGRAGSVHEYLMELHKQYGDIASFWWGKEFVVSICSPELFKQHAAVFDRPFSLFSQFEPLLGKKSIEYTNKEEGRNRRKLYDEVFAHSYLHHYYEGMQEVTDDLVKQWSVIAKDEHIPLSQYMMAFALKLGLVNLFGGNAWTNEEILKIRHHYDVMFSEMARSVTEDIGEEGWGAFEESKKKLAELVKKSLSNRKKLKKDTDEYLFIDVLLDSSDDEELIFSESTTFIVGGFQTTGSLLTWAIYYLVTHQDVEDKVYKEIKRILGDEDVSPGSSKQLVYLHQVIDETLRCALIATWTARYQDFDSELGGHKIPKNTSVIHAIGVSLKNEKYYPDPDKFDPDRFSPENTKSRPTLAFQPFGFAGKRMCPGYKFAITETTIALVTLLRTFKIEMVEGQVVTPLHRLVTTPAEEIWITIQKR